ncbi:MAG: hypothetical protein MUF35_01595 [Candidatus Nanopelagicales bacterium]|jgi:hypothetical protein|nr:hypothetical protein [Candidatus Nanopelagicales bacterium]
MAARTLAQKLLIRPGSAVWCSDPTRLHLLGPLPEGVTQVEGFAAADVAVVLVDDEAGLRGFAEVHRDLLGVPRALWLCYPKGNRIALNRDSLWRLMAAYGVRPITQVAIDEVWSALRFRPLTEAERASAGRFTSP